jgi:hypothetical protein
MWPCGVAPGSAGAARLGSIAALLCASGGGAAGAAYEVSKSEIVDTYFTADDVVNSTESIPNTYQGAGAAWLGG